MKWLEAAARMEAHVIKKDSTSTDSDYFMATHVPFQSLEFIASGDTGLSPRRLTEEDIYHNCFAANSNHHQMIMVRGTNGTGKSHLICWLYNRLIFDREHYDPEKEKVVFLRRLRNTSRGAIQQMLEAGLIQDPELQEKFRKFVSMSLSQGEDEFKTTIYHTYITKVSTDSSKEYYKPARCKNIASFLSDSRVQEYFLREGGPIARCYRTITGGVDPNDGTAKAVFEASDFKFPRELVRKIRADGAREVSGFYLEELDGDAKAMAALAAYLNHFTSPVIQSCANITSENIRELFENLRRNLKREGKRLTILIEDFTSFSIVDSELITALAVEPGGEYHDLCPVTSVMGITDGHYDSFHDNFKDRVFSQINVTEQSFGAETFITEMAARYLNAVYCGPEQIREWYEQGARYLPAATFRPDFEWDSVTVGQHTFTLYPFTKKSLVTMFQHLKERKPRHFLDTIIRQMFRQFANGMEDHDWYFPELPPNIGNIPMNTTYANSVEQSPLQDGDKRRLKVLLAVWGDGTSRSSEHSIGEIPKAFLAEIGLSAFSGLQQAMAVANRVPSVEKTVSGAQEPANGRAASPLSKREIAYQNFMEDIQNWFETNAPLRYDDDYFKWLSTFVLNGIPWQDEGIPAYYVLQRWQNGGFLMIEGSEKSIKPETAIIYLKRTSETRTILAGLASYNLHSGWDFQDSSYYQYVLVTWLEKNKALIKQNLCGDCVRDMEQPVITWCLALEYLQRLLCGEALEESSNDRLLQQLFSGSSAVNNYQSRDNAAWNDVFASVKNAQSIYMQVREYLQKGANTSMGVAGDPVQSSAKIYRYSELIRSLEHLRQKNWDLSDELNQIKNPKQFSMILRQLDELYHKIETVVAQEKQLAQKALEDFHAVFGEAPTIENLAALSGEIASFFAQCNQSNQPYPNHLKEKFDEEPLEFAQRVQNIYASVHSRTGITDHVALLQAFSQNPVGALRGITSSLNELAALADKAKNQHQPLTGVQISVDTERAQQATRKLAAVLMVMDGWRAAE